MITKTCDKCGEVICSKAALPMVQKAFKLLNGRNDIEAHMSFQVYDMNMTQKVPYPCLDSPTSADICERCLKDIFGELCAQTLQEKSNESR